MIAKKVFVNYHNFNLIWVQHASIHVKRFWYSSKKKVFVKVSSYKIYSEPGLEPEQQPQIGFAAPWSRGRSRSRKK
jgi:hypothetical protein